MQFPNGNEFCTVIQNPQETLDNHQNLLNSSCGQKLLFDKISTTFIRNFFELFSPQTERNLHGQCSRV